MDEDQYKNINFEPKFNINKLSFNNVSKEFESKFRDLYKNSLVMMSDDRDRLTNASGASTLGILEKMAGQISQYSKNSDFEQSYNTIQKEYEPYKET